MFGTHNTYIKKLFSNNFETNALEPVNIELSKVVVPTVNLLPYNDVVRTIAATGTIYTTPTDKDFFLTGFCLSMYGDTEEPFQGSAQISFITEDEITQTFWIKSIENGNGAYSISHTFPLRGVRLKKGSDISFTAPGSLSNCLINGYVASDRS
jgi:hypothetical protein